jgi:hypothetical protein
METLGNKRLYTGAIPGLNANPVSFLRREDDNVFCASGMYSNHPAPVCDNIKDMSIS